MLQAGQLLDDKYRIVRLVGEGGMGAVFEAEHVFLGRRTAIKVLAADYARNPEAVKRFYREAQAAARIGHENICEVTDIGQTPEGLPYIVMQLLQGKSLARVIQEAAPLPIGRTVDIACQSLEALGAAHAAGIVHRDMKPDNVFLTRVGGRDDFVKLLDFGISKVRSKLDRTKLTQEGTVLGTPQYMSPEQARGETDVDGRTDLWAVGVMVFEMLTGRIPFEGENYNKIIFNVVAAPIPRLRALREGVSPELEAAVMRAMERGLPRRFQSTSEFRDALLSGWMGTTESGFAVKVAVPTPPPFGEDATELAPQLVPPPLVPPARQGGGMVIGTPVPTPVGGTTSPVRPASAVVVVETTTPVAMVAPDAPVADPSSARAGGTFGTVNVTPNATLAAGALRSASARLRRVPVAPLVIAIATLTGIIVFLLTRSAGTPDGPAQADGVGTKAAAAVADGATQVASSASTSALRDQAPDAGPATAREPAALLGESSAPPVAMKARDTMHRGEVDAGVVSPDSGTAPPLPDPPPIPAEPNSGRPARDGGEPQASAGMLSVSTDPWTDVFIDDEFLARAPFARRSVASGIHRLRLVNEVAGISIEEPVEIRPGGLTAIRRGAAQLGVSSTVGGDDAGGVSTSRRDAGQLPDGIRIRTGTYGRDAR